MPRPYAHSKKGQTRLISSSARYTRSKVGTDDTLQSGPNSSRKHSIPRSTLSKTHPASRASINPSDSDDASSAADDEDEEDEEDEEEDDADEPESFAPSHATIMRQTGRTRLAAHTRNISPQEFEGTLFTDSDDDDDFYERVNEVSDYEDDVRDEALEAFELPHIVVSDDEEDPNAVINHIDELSWCGFGSDIGSIDDNSSISDVAVQRRVRFASEPVQPKGLAGSLSPTITRALMPSALPYDADVFEAALNSRQFNDDLVQAPRSRGVQFEDPYDSDATADDLPAEAHTTPNALHRAFAEPTTSEESPPPAERPGRKRCRRQKGPRIGVFQVDRDKPWAILHPSGNKMLLLPAPNTDRHDWLATVEEDSIQSSPETSFAQLLEENDGSVDSEQDAPVSGADADIMLAGLAADNNGADDGQATGPAEAFYRPGYQIVGDYVLSPEQGNLDSASDSPDEDDLIDMEDLIAFDSDDDSGDESPTSPAIFVPPPHLLATSNLNDFAHLNNQNVTAFRRSADPNQAALDRPTTFPLINSPQTALPATPTTLSRKRKASNLPYQGDHYEGVTPVQRKVISRMSMSMTKRRKMTA